MLLEKEPADDLVADCTTILKAIGETKGNLKQTIIYLQRL